MAYQFEKSGQLKVPTAEELAASDTDSAVLVLNQGTVEGKPYWVYIAVKPSKYAEFMKIVAQHKPLDLNEYGVVLKFGFDKEVPPAIKEEMKREHGCHDNYIAKVTKAVIEEQAIFLKQQETQRIGDIVTMLKKKPNGSA